MYQTDHGLFDGDSWERLCQVCFRLKYSEEGYQPIEASPGDFGIEGFTRTGRAFQCYCPEYNYAADELYKKLRKKVTTDLRKLITYEKELKKYLGKVKIKEWILVTPHSRKKDLVRHCNSKAEEYRKKALSHLHKDFDVMFMDIDFFAKELPIALGQVDIQVQLTCTIQPSAADVANWGSTQSSLESNAQRKHRARFNPEPGDIEERVGKLTTKTIFNYLEGNEKLRSWEELYQDRYERFQKVTSHFERRVEEKCLIPVSNNDKLLNEIRQELTNRLKTEFPELDILTIEDLSEHAISKWILECPIDFT
ncbi:MAG: hypothetical protein JRJ38_10580 [Deltaproteobacteria bacterium]|nr:hypothetical protein [Deltaproteobacteria bacterium]